MWSRRRVGVSKGGNGGEGGGWTHDGKVEEPRREDEEEACEGDGRVDGLLLRAVGPVDLGHEAVALRLPPRRGGRFFGQGADELGREGERAEGDREGLWGREVADEEGEGEGGGEGEEGRGGAGDVLRRKQEGVSYGAVARGRDEGGARAPSGLFHPCGL